MIFILSIFKTPLT